jgi:hypothetical protein
MIMPSGFPGGIFFYELEHDPEKCVAVFHATNAKRVCAQIMLNQRTKAR